jgi:hypothetical protein
MYGAARAEEGVEKMVFLARATATRLLRLLA